MFKIICEFLPDFHIKNNQQLTPLSLAAKLGRKEVNFEIF